MKLHFNLMYLISLFLIGCSTYSEGDKLMFDEAIKEYIKAKNLNMEKLESGMYYSIIEEGRGRNILLKDKVTFHYKGSFLNDEVFQVIPKNDPLTFYVRELIVGWQDGLTLLKNNGKIKLIIPPHLAYGDQNTDLVPPNSILVYTIEVLDVK